MNLTRFIFFVLLVLILEIGLLIGISIFFETNMVNTMFFGSCFFVLFAFLIHSTGDALSKNSQAAVFHSLIGHYQPKHEKATLSISPFLIGSILCFAVYFALYYLGIIS